MSKDNKSCLHIFNDWFYLLLLVLVGFVLLGANLGFLPVYILAYWPVLLIVIAIKEILDRH
ncbi:hypothetical protein KJ836_02155 [Patescibacteria group bacterium]|nr:hypothetical protein [Patescibacteria group bacterium]